METPSPNPTPYHYLGEFRELPPDQKTLVAQKMISTMGLFHGTIPQWIEKAEQFPVFIVDIEENRRGRNYVCATLALKTLRDSINQRMHTLIYDPQMRQNRPLQPTDPPFNWDRIKWEAGYLYHNDGNSEVCGNREFGNVIKLFVENMRAKNIPSEEVITIVRTENAKSNALHACSNSSCPLIKQVKSDIISDVWNIYQFNDEGWMRVAEKKIARGNIPVTPPSPSPSSPTPSHL